MIDFRQLVKVGIHFGHQTSRWCPKMAPYIWGFKNKVHLIDVSKTAYQLEKAAQFLEKRAAKGESILWIGTKKAAQEAIYKTAIKLGQPYVNHRWIGGTLSNYSQVKKSVTKLLHYEDIVAKSEKFSYYTKKELNMFQKIINRLKRSIGGICDLTWPIGALVVVDVEKEQSAIKEAVIMGIPVVAIVDTNGDPSLVDYVVPANDDSPQAINVILSYLAQAVVKGEEIAKDKKSKLQKEEERAKQNKKEAESQKRVENTKNKVTMAKKVVEKKPIMQKEIEANKSEEKKSPIVAKAKEIKSSPAIKKEEVVVKETKKKMTKKG